MNNRLDKLIDFLGEMFPWLDRPVFGEYTIDIAMLLSGFALGVSLMTGVHVMVIYGSHCS